MIVFYKQFFALVDEMLTDVLNKGVHIGIVVFSSKTYDVTFGMRRS